MTMSTDLNPRLLSRGIIGPGYEVDEVSPRLGQPEKKLKVKKYLESSTKLRDMKWKVCTSEPPTLYFLVNSLDLEILWKLFFQKFNFK